MAESGGGMIKLAISSILAGTVTWEGLNLLFNANTTGVNATVVTLGTTVVGIMVAIAMFLIVLRQGGLTIK